MKNNKKRPEGYNTESAFEPYPDFAETAATGDCTGMIYTPPKSEEENESYKDLHGMQIPKKKDI